jgi:hypothetical protein
MTVHTNGEFTDGPYTYINYVYKGIIKLDDVIKETSKYNVIVKFHIDYLVNDNLSNLNKRFEYKFISNDFIDKYRNNLVSNVKVQIVKHYNIIKCVTVNIKYIYEQQ